MVTLIPQAGTQATHPHPLPDLVQMATGLASVTREAMAVQLTQIRLSVEFSTISISLLALCVVHAEVEAE